MTVVLLVDQMRGDELARYDAGFRFGMRRLLDGGRQYTQAMHTHGRTAEAPGHATWATGLLPEHHGVIDDALYLPERGGIKGVCELGLKGCDASALLVPTLGDRLKAANADSRVVAVASRPEAASLLAGRSGDLAIWMQNQNIALGARDNKSPGVPAWLQTLFGQLATPENVMRTWALGPVPQALGDIEDRAAGERDCGHGLRFPHRIPQSASGAALVDMWQCTPDSDRVMLETALQTAQHLALGKDDAPDLLYVSLGATARVGEAYGYESLERAVTLLALDASLGAFLDALIEQVGPRVLVVLSSDQGLAPKVAQARAGGHVSGRVDPQSFVARLEADLSHFGPGPHVASMRPPFVHLHAPTAALRAAKASAAAQSLAHAPGVYKAWTPADLSVDPDPIARLLQASYNATRGGDVVVALNPYFALAQAKDGELGAASGSPWPYDRHVPLVLYGYNIAPGHVDHEVSIVDAVRSVGDALGLAPPSQGGKPLIVPAH